MTYIKYFTQAILFVSLAFSATSAAFAPAVQEDYSFTVLTPDFIRPSSSVALQDGIIAFGDPFDDDSGEDAGAIHLIDSITGELLSKITPEQTTERNLNLGSNLALHNNTLVAGMPRYQSTGAVLVYDATTGNLRFTLQAPNPTPGDSFGSSVAIHNNIIAIGAPGNDDLRFNSGAAYLYNANTGELLKNLYAIDSSDNDRFGNSIAIENNLVVVGCYGDNLNLQLNAGSVYIFDAKTGSQTGHITPQVPEWNGWFGYKVAVLNGIIATSDSTVTTYTAIYTYNASTGELLAKLTPPVPNGNLWFGKSFAIDGDLIAVSNARHRTAHGYGAVHLFNIFTGEHFSTLIPSIQPNDRLFGTSVDMVNGTVVAPRDEKIFIFNDPLQTFDCPPDINQDYILSYSDITLFLNAYQQNYIFADINQDSRINFLDISAYLNEYSSGCP